MYHFKDKCRDYGEKYLDNFFWQENIYYFFFYSYFTIMWGNMYTTIFCKGKTDSPRLLFLHKVVDTWE